MQDNVNFGIGYRLPMEQIALVNNDRKRHNSHCRALKYYFLLTADLTDSSMSLAVNPYL
jgi:hypothetical protein